MTDPIRSKQICGVFPKPEILAKLRLQFKVPDPLPEDGLALSIFEVTVHGTTRYCCWAGGELIAPPEGSSGPPIPSLTPAGQATVETMIEFPFFQGKLAFIQLVKGKTPTRIKVLDAFASTPEDMMLCFFGDLAKTMDGQMYTSMNMQDFVDLKDCIGITPPAPTTAQ